MTDAELNMAIAELIEPKPSNDHEYMAIGDTSDGEGWVSGWDTNDETGISYPGWHPRDFCSDPACTVMLLERLVVARGFVSLSAWISSPMRICLTGQFVEGIWKSDEPSTFAASHQLGRAVAEAFWLANQPTKVQEELH